MLHNVKGKIQKIRDTAKVKVCDNNVSVSRPQKENENELVYLGWQMRKTKLK